MSACPGSLVDDQYRSVREGSDMTTREMDLDVSYATGTTTKVDIDISWARDTEHSYISHHTHCNRKLG